MKRPGEKRIVRNDPRKLGAKCDMCPLKGRPPVFGEYSPDARIIICKDSPDSNEEIQGRPFLGEAGWFIERAGKEKKIARKDMHLVTATLCKPSADDKPRDKKVAARCCLPRLKEELKLTNCRHILASGDLSMYSLIGREGITKWMGAVYEATVDILRPGHRVLPTLDLEFVLSLAGRQQLSVVSAHFNTLVGLAQGKLPEFAWPEFHINPDNGVVKALEQIKRERLPVGFDVENVPSTGVLMCLSLANENVGISVPWHAYGNKHGQVLGLRDYKSGVKIRKLVVEILEDAGIEKIMQNGAHDAPLMEKEGVHISGYAWDTMLMHAIVYPPLRHTLNFISAQYTHAERWKDVFKAHKDEKGVELFAEANEVVLREYNAKDSLILPILHKTLLLELNTMERGVEQYKALFERAQIALHMGQRGVPIDESLFPEKEIALGEKTATYLTKLKDLYKAVTKTDDDYNPDSPIQTKHLFTDVLGAPVLGRSEKTGKPTVDKKVLSAYLADHNPMVQYAAQTLLEYRKWKKLHGFMLDGALNGVPIVDGICHTAWKTHGTRTGRWTSPLLILPKEKTEKLDDGTIETTPGMRDLCLGHNGNWFIEADYKSLELVVIALLAGDQEMLDIFARDGDIHREVAKGVFKVNDPSKEQRQVVKTFNYGLIYGAADATLWKTLRSMGANLSLDDVTNIRHLWFKSRPRIKSYLDTTLRIAYKRDYVEAPLSGRRYYFYGKVEPSKVYNNPIQMTAADLINRIFPLVYKDLNWKDEGILMQVHDAICIDTPDPVRGWDILHNRMTQEVEYNGSKASFKVDIEIGKNFHSVQSCTRQQAIELAKAR